MKWLWHRLRRHTVVTFWDDGAETTVCLTCRVKEIGPEALASEADQLEQKWGRA